MSQFKVVKVELNHETMDALLKCAEVQKLLLSHAKKIAGKDGEVELYVAQTRAVAEARGNNKDNGLLKRML